MDIVSKFFTWPHDLDIWQRCCDANSLRFITIRTLNLGDHVTTKSGVLFSSPSVALATGLGVGFFPFAPGTFGTLWGLPITWLVLNLPLAGQFIAILAIFAVGIPICHAAAKRLDMKDPGCVVWDEFATLPIVFIGIPYDDVMQQPLIIAAGFVLHRIFDISKLPPARQLERLPGGLGIMADDVAAAIYARLVMFLLV